MPHEVGLRVSIRLFDPAGGFRDLLGHLTSPTQVRKRDGSVVEFDPSTIFLWKVVPERPDRAIEPTTSDD